jgi:hypothetical protein
VPELKGQSIWIAWPVRYHYELRQTIAHDILPDYDISTEELYTRVANWFCTSGLYASELIRFGISYPRNLKNLPTWLPDRTSPPVVYLEETIYSAGGTHDKPVLTDAYRVGVLAAPLPQPLLMDSNGPTRFALDACALVERSFPDRLTALTMPQSEEHPWPKDETLWRTLLIDSDFLMGRLTSPAPRPHRIGFPLLHEAAKVDPLFHKRANDDHEAERFLGALSNSNGRTFGVTEGFGMAMVPPLS